MITMQIEKTELIIEGKKQPKNNKYFYRRLVKYTAKNGYVYYLTESSSYKSSETILIKQEDYENLNW